MFEAPNAIVIDGASTLDVDDPSVIRGKKVLVVEDGPTLTHGEMKIGAGVVAAPQVRSGRAGGPASVHGGTLDGNI